MLQAGIVTRAQLVRASSGDAEPGGRLVAKLVSEGVWEDAIAGYLVATGFGPLQHVRTTAASDPTLAHVVPAEQARAMGVAPMARRGNAVLLAMADPSDVVELDRLRARASVDLLPALVRHGEVARLVEAIYGESQVAPGSGEEPSDDDEEHMALPLIRAKPAPPATEASPPSVEAEKEDRWASTPPEPPPDIEPQLEAIASAVDRDAAIDRACEALLGVARSAWFMSLRKNALLGVRGKGVSNDVVRRLTVPVDADSRAADVVQRGEPYDGTLGSSSADSALIEAVSARGSRVVLHPVFVEERLLGILCADEVTHGEHGAERVGRVADTLGEAFRQLLLAAKNKNR